MMSNRRDFLKASAALAAAGAISSTCAEGDESPAGGIAYVRKAIPSIPPKAYAGAVYEDSVPDTFDVAERAKLAINGLTGPTDSAADHELYWRVVFSANPPHMYHDWNDWVQIKFMEALPLLRLVTGSKHDDAVDQVWREVTLKSIGPDGLYYMPFNGRPWGRGGDGGAPYFGHPVARANGSLTAADDPTIAQCSHPYMCQRILGALAVHYLHEGNPIWEQAMKRMIDRLLALAIHKEDYCYLPSLSYEPNARYDRNDPRAAMPTGHIVLESNTRLCEGAAHCYRATGYGPAKELAEKIARFTRFHGGCFGPHGEFAASLPGGFHFHCHAIALLSMLEHGLAVGDKDLMEFVRQGFEWARSPVAGSSSLIGFFPERASPTYPSCETCEIADMIALALKLSEGGAGDHYADAERWARNHFAESQLMDTSWIPRHVARFPKSPVPPNATTDQIAQRNLGAFAGWSSASDWLSHGPGIMHCCTGNAARTLYYLWQHILTHQDGRLRINMLLNRASPWADVYSHIPYEGRVDVKIKTACASLSVHVPEWIEPDGSQLVATVDGKPRTFRWKSRYIDLGNVEAGSTIVLKFPIAQRTVKETIGTVGCTLTLKGNTVIAIDPKGTTCPLYERQKYASSQAPMKKVSRFVSDERIAW
jgi:hypothetical protein